MGKRLTKKEFNKKHGYCPCGSGWEIRINSTDKKAFLGCKKYPNCTNTKSI